MGMTRTSSSRGRRGGFTLIELLVVIVILGILATLYVTNVLPAAAKAKRDLTIVQMGIVIGALDQFKLDVGSYPDALDDLIEPPSSLTDSQKYRTGGYLKELPNDGWHNKFMYQRNSSKKGFELASLGADSKVGGVGYDADIVK